MPDETTNKNDKSGVNVEAGKAAPEAADQPTESASIIGRLTAFVTEKRDAGLSLRKNFTFQPLSYRAHWLEKSAEAIFRAICMAILTLYPFVLVYFAGVGMFPRQNVATAVGPFSWVDLLSIITSLLVNGAYLIVKKHVERINKFTYEMWIVLLPKIVLLVCGWIYVVFQNPMSSQPAPFQAPPFGVLISNPIFIVPLMLILVDTLRPSFLREKLLFVESTETQSAQK